MFYDIMLTFLAHNNLNKKNTTIYKEGQVFYKVQNGKPFR